MVVPGLYGYVSATKWVVDLEVTRFADRAAYWTNRGWAPRAPIKLASRIDVPASGTTLPTGPVVVAGVAWAQYTGLAAVEVAVDDGPWQSAQLAETVGPDTWRQWRFDWVATPGTHHLAVRAVDASGAVQTANVQGVLPDGATGHHQIRVTCR
jgi:sulfite oxidase